MTILASLAPGLIEAGNRLLDRLTQHCHIVATGNDSYRFRHSSVTAKSRVKAREQTKRGGPKDAPF